MSWTPNRTIPGKLSRSAPALAEHAGMLHMVHAGDSSNDIWHSWWNGVTWEPDRRIAGQQSKAPAALASFGGRLHLVHLGDSSNQLWHSTWDGTSWSANVQIAGARSHSPVALASFGGLLHCVHTGDMSNELVHLTFDGQAWTKRPVDFALADMRSSMAPALAVHGGLLHLVHPGNTSHDIWHSTWNGAVWTANAKIPGQRSRAPSAMASANGLLHLVHLGDSDNEIWHSVFDGTTWAPGIRVPHQLASASPALATCLGRLHMVHTGDSEHVLWHSVSDGTLINRPTRRVIVLDIDGVRWDSFYRHLKQVRDAQASTTATYRFTLPNGASDDTLLKDGGHDLHSGLAELCFGSRSGMVDVRFARSSYPTFTFPTHATMYTGNWPRHHGLAGHSFVVRDTPGDWDWHRWDALPRALSLAGFCTNEEGSFGAFLDYVWGGFDQVSEGACQNRNRGLNSDLRVRTMFHRVHHALKRSTAIHAFYHGADEPWTPYGRDQWWHYDASELRSVKDVCSESDVDQLEVVDHGTFAKAETLLKFLPSSASAIRNPSSPADPLPPTVGRAFQRRDGTPVANIEVHGQDDPDGPPHLIALYLASADEASHQDSPRNQATYLAWFDHRLARFLRELEAADPEVYNNTIFAITADHGHRVIDTSPDNPDVSWDNVLIVREHLLRMVQGDAFVEQLMTLADEYQFLDYGRMVHDALAPDTLAWAEAMNLYVYLRDRPAPAVLSTAQRLLALTMYTEPYGALVLLNGEYQFLGRGESRPVPLVSQAARQAIVPHLDPPPPPAPGPDAEIEAVSLTGVDETRERALRTRLNSDDSYDLLAVVRRVRGFEPNGFESMPDIILLAPKGKSFSVPSKSTHGSFAYPVTRIPMVFCGPGMPARRRTIEEADLVDFAPTVLTLLGVDTRGMDGRSLLDAQGRVRSATAAARVRHAPGADAPEAGAEPPTPPRRPSTIRDKTQLPAVHIAGQVAAVVAATGANEELGLPTYVAIDVQSRRAGLRAGEPRRLTRGPVQRVRLASARIVAGDVGRCWLTGPKAARTRPARDGELHLPASGTLEVGSSDAVSNISVPRALLVVPVGVELPRIPGWVEELMESLRSRSRLGLAGLDARGQVLLTADDFVTVVRGLDVRLNPDPSTMSYRRNLQSPAATHADVLAAVERLRDLLAARTVTRATLAPE